MKQCERCKKEIKFRKCYEISYGLLDRKEKYDNIDEIDWLAGESNPVKICPKCFKSFKNWLKEVQNKT